MGVGFAFGGRDTGLGKVAGKVAGSFGSITGAVAGLNQRLSKGFSDLKGRISGALSALPSNLTTGYEAELTAMDKSARQMAANMGYSTKQMGAFSSQATSLGISLNRSAEEAGKAIFAWDKGSDVLKAVGIDSKETALKVQDVFGVDMTKFVFTLKEMGQTLGMDNAAIKRMTDSTLAWGQQSGDVSKALNGMQQQVDHLNKRAHAFGKTLSGDELAQWAESGNQAKQLLFAIGNNAEQAETAVNAMQEQFLEQGKNMGKMFAGTSDDLTDWQKHFAIAGADIEGQFDLMKQGPLGFIKGLSGMVDKAGGFANMTGEQMNFIKRQLEEALGPDVADQIFNVFKKGGTAVSDMIKKLPKATEDMGKLAKSGFRTGRTLADSLELAGNQFMHMLRASRKVRVETGKLDKNGNKLYETISVGTKYVRDAQKAYKDWGDKLLKISKQDGALGMLAGKLLDIHQIGVAGLLPESVRGYVPVLQKLGSEFGPILTGLGQMVPLITMLASPTFLVVAAFAALVFWFKSAQKEGDTFSDTISTMQQQAMNFFGNLETWLVEKFPKHAKTIHAIITVLEFGFWAISSVVSEVMTGLGILFDFIESSLNGEVNSLADFGDTFRNIWLYEIVGPIKNYFTELWLDIKTTAEGVWNGLTESVKTAIGFWVQIINDQIDALVAPFKAIDGWVDKLFRHSIDSDMKDSFAAAQKHADKFAANMSSSLATATAPMSALTGNVSVSPGGATKRLPPPTRPPPTVSSEARDASLINAVNSPHWYARYEQLFMQRMMALEAAMKGSAAATAPRGGGQRPTKTAGKGGNKRFDLGLNARLAGDTAGRPISEEDG